MSSNITAQTIRDLSADLTVYWKPILDQATAGQPYYFTAKIFYMGNDLGSPQMLARMFPSELRKQGGVYLEMLDFELQPREIGFRVLYFLPHNPSFTTDYKLVPNDQGGSYIVPKTALQEINRTSAHLPFPVIGGHVEAAPVAAPVAELVVTATPDSDRFNEAALSEDRPELTDESYSKMTIRDHFAITHRKPVSQKGWLNALILETNAQDSFRLN